jgi:hypothetical protein
MRRYALAGGHALAVDTVNPPGFRHLPTAGPRRVSRHASRGAGKIFRANVSSSRNADDSRRISQDRGEMRDYTRREMIEATRKPTKERRLAALRGALREGSWRGAARRRAAPNADNRRVARRTVRLFSCLDRRHGDF